MIQEQTNHIDIRDLSEKLEGFLASVASPGEYTPSQLADLLDGLQPLESWMKAMRDEALRRILSGEDIRGYEAHSRKYRVIEYSEEAIQALAAYDPQAAEQCVSRKFANISHIKKVIGKEAFEKVLGEYTVTRESVALARKKVKQSNQQ